MCIIMIYIIYIKLNHNMYCCCCCMQQHACMHVLSTLVSQYLHMPSTFTNSQFDKLIDIALCKKIYHLHKNTNLPLLSSLSPMALDFQQMQEMEITLQPCFSSRVHMCSQSIYILTMVVTVTTNKANHASQLYLLSLDARQNQKSFLHYKRTQFHIIYKSTQAHQPAEDGFTTS